MSLVKTIKRGELARHGYVPPEGITEQVLSKASDDDADLSWSRVIDLTTQQEVGQKLLPATTAEIAAGVTPVNFAYKPELLELKRFMSTAQAAGDGVTDCRSALQAACDVMPDNQGGIILVPRGIWRCEGTIFAKPKTTIVGQGWASQINFYAQANGDTCIENDLAAAGPDGVIDIRDLYLNLANPESFHSVIGVDLRDRSGGGTEHAAKCRIIGVKFTNWNWRAVFMDKSFVSYIDLCEFQSVKNLMYATQAGGAWCIFVNGTGNGVTIRWNYFTDYDGILRSAGAVTNASFTFEENTCDPSANYANPALAEKIFFEGGAAGAALSIVRNYFEGLRTGPSGGPGTDAAIRIDDVAAADISGNYFQGDLSGTDVTFRHIRIEPGCRNVVIEKNFFQDPTNAYVAVEAGAEDSIVRNNRYIFGGAAEVTMPAVRSRIIGTCLLENNEYQQTIAYAASITPDARAGKYIAINALTGALTINAPTNPPTQPGMPRDIFIELLQDATGGRAVTLNAVFVSNYADTGNTANTRNHGRFTWSGSEWRGDWTGWF